MKIMSAYNGGQGAHITILLPGFGIAEAVAKIAALLNAPTTTGYQDIQEASHRDAQSSNPLVEEAIARTQPPAGEPIADTSIQTVAEDPAPQRRRRRTAAEMAEAAATETAPAAETTSRRRRTAAPEATPDPMPINDAEMSKAASDAAQALVEMGFDGPGTVKLVLADFQVQSVGDIPQEKRKEFIAELQKEIAGAKAEKG